MRSCNATAIEHEREAEMLIVSVLKGTIGAHASGFVTSLVILHLASGWEAIMQTVSTKYPTE